MQPESAVNSIRMFGGFARGSLKLMLRGNRMYWTWLAFLGALIVSGALAYSRQVEIGLGLTAMRDQVSWGFYIGNFTFLVGVAAAAVVLVIPAYIYNWKPIREIVIYGELLAISAITMCLLFVLVISEFPEQHPGLGRARAEPVLHLELFGGHPHPVPRLSRQALHQKPCGPAGAAFRPHGGRHSHCDSVPLQRPGCAPLLE